MPSVRMETARTTQREPSEAAEHLLSQLEGPDPKLVTLFASRERNQPELNRALRSRLPKGTRLIGATTGGEVDRDGFHTGSAVLGALSGDFEVGLGLGEKLSLDAVSAGERASKAACSELGVRQANLDTKRHVGVVIDDGYQQKKEELLLGVLAKNQGLVLVGGGANDMHPVNGSAELHVDGEVVTDAALVALFECSAPWAALRSHSYEPLGQTLLVTKTDDTCKRVLEIDGQPAASRYAELLGVEVSDLEFGKPRGFANTSVALKVGREYFMRSPWMPLPDGSIVFANLVEEDTELEMMRLVDMPESTRRFFDHELPERVVNPTAALLFHCSGRMLVAQNTGVAAALGEAFAQAPPSVGFNVHFELFCGFHINTTLTTLAFGSHE